MGIEWDKVVYMILKYTLSKCLDIHSNYITKRNPTTNNIIQFNSTFIAFDLCKETDSNSQGLSLHTVRPIYWLSHGESLYRVSSYRHTDILLAGTQWGWLVQGLSLHTCSDIVILAVTQWRWLVRVSSYRHTDILAGI